MTDHGAPFGADLTPREREVLAMLAAGMTNREIGEALFITESTAGVHVSNIMAKLGAGSRTEAAAAAYHAGMVESAPSRTYFGESANEGDRDDGNQLPGSQSPVPGNWWQDLIQTHPRRVAAIGVGALVVLSFITIGLAAAVLSSDPPVAGPQSSPSDSASPVASASARPTVRPSSTPMPATPTASPSAAPTSTPSPTPEPAYAWSTAGNMIFPHSGHTATRLLDGEVLVAGGSNVTSNGAIASSELYNPDTGTWTATGNMSSSRISHTATLLPDGRVLVAGGTNVFDLDPLATAELWDPLRGTWEATGNLLAPRTGHTATLLPDGTVLVAGGWTSGGASGLVASAERYDPHTGSWVPTGGMTEGRLSHTATLLPDGTVLVTGGYGGPGGYGMLASAELYNPDTGTWAVTGNMSWSRVSHTATLLPDGTVLVTGGASSIGSTPSAERYDPALEAWTNTGRMQGSRASHTATLLPDGTVLVVGRTTSGNVSPAERYDPDRGFWATAGDLTDVRSYHTATLLPDGSVLVAGGDGPYGYEPLSSVELYRPVSGP